MHTEKKAVVLLSGGLDSTTVTAIAKQQGFKLFCISFAYEQRHLCELNAAKKAARFFNAEAHLILNLPLRAIGGSSLTDDIDVQKNSNVADIPHEIPLTYVPARNTIFLSYALAWAETLAISDLFIGVNAVDYSGYPDCRPEFISAFEQMANLATRYAVTTNNAITIHAPLINLTKSDIIRQGVVAGVDYSITHSCYDPDDDGIACGHCDSCLLRLKGFEAAGLADPIPYQQG